MVTIKYMYIIMSTSTRQVDIYKEKSKTSFKVAQEFALEQDLIKSSLI